MKTNSLQQKSSKNLLLFLHALLNFNEIGCKQYNERDHIDSIFVTFKYTAHEFREKLFWRVKFEIQIRAFFSAKPSLRSKRFRGV